MSHTATIWPDAAQTILRGTRPVGPGSAEHFAGPAAKKQPKDIPINRVGLLDLPMALSRGEYMALARAGLTTPEQVLGVSVEALRQVVGAERAARLGSTQAKTGAAVIPG